MEPAEGQPSPAKRTMPQEAVEGAAVKLEEAIEVENLSQEDIQAVVEAARRKLTKKLRVG